MKNSDKYEKKVIILSSGFGDTVIADTRYCLGFSKT